jgi:hypothetical protein
MPIGARVAALERAIWRRSRWERFGVAGLGDSVDKSVCLRQSVLNRLGPVGEGRIAVAKVSRETASQVQEIGPVTDRGEDLGGYTVNFVSFAADADLDGPLAALPGGACQCPHCHEEVYEAGDAFYQPPGHRPYVEAGTELLQFSPTDKLDETERAIAAWMSRQQDAAS